MNEDLSNTLQKVPLKIEEKVTSSENKTPKSFLEKLLEIYDTTIKEEEKTKIESHLLEKCNKTKDIVSQILLLIQSEKDKNDELLKQMIEDKDPSLKKEHTLKVFKEDCLSKQKKIEDLTTLYEDLQLKHRKVTNQLNITQDELLTSQKKLEDLKFDLERASEKVSEQNSQIHKLKNSQGTQSPVTPITPQITNIQGSEKKVVEDLRMEITIRKKAYEELNQKYSELFGQMDNLKYNFDMLTRDHLHLENEMRRLTYAAQNSDKYKMEIEKLYDDNIRLRGDVQEVQRMNNAKMKQILDTEQIKRASVYEEVKKREYEIQKLLGENENLKSKLAQSESLGNKDQINLLNKILEEQQERIKNYEILVEKNDLNLSKENITLEKIIYQKTREIEELKKLTNQTVEVVIEETDIERLKEQLLAQKEECDLYLKELDNSAISYNEILNKNTALTQKIISLEEQNSNFVHERIKMKFQINSKDSDLDLMRQKLEKMNETLKSSENSLENVKFQLHSKEDLYLKQSDELRNIYYLFEKKCKKIQEIEQLYGDLKYNYEKMNGLFIEIQNKNTDTDRKLLLEIAKTKNLTIENEILKKKTETKIGGDEDYKKMVTCGVCHTKQKDTIITRCYHTFCKECVAETLRVRNRKCPSCGLKFGDNDVHNFFL